MTATSVPRSILGLGHALLDSFVKLADDGMLAAHGLNKGHGHHIDPVDAEALAAVARTHQPGGSIANSLAVIAALGGDAEFIGKVGDDEAGRLFRGGMRAGGVRHYTPAGVGPTGRCIVLVSPDGERTMVASLGTSTALSIDDINESHFEGRAAFLFDGYLLNLARTTMLCRRAVRRARENSAFVATSLADAGLVRDQHERFQSILSQDVQVLFANQGELAAFTGAEDPADGLDAFTAFPHLTVFATLGPDGVLVRANGAITHLPAEKVARVVDTTGAGDAFAAGTLYGLVEGRGALESARLGLSCAARIIQQVGARPEVNLRDLAAAPATAA